jgi:hypothetical protein
MSRFLIRLTDGSSLPMLEEKNGDHVGLKDDKFLYVKIKAQNKLLRVPWTSVLRIEETIEDPAAAKPAPEAEPEA